MISSTKFIGGHEVRSGLRLPVPSNRDRVSFTLTAVCETATPERWHGEVSFAGTTLLTTETVNSHGEAGRAAERALTAKIVDLFSA